VVWFRPKPLTGWAGGLLIELEMKKLLIFVGLCLAVSGTEAAVVLTQTFDYSSQAGGGYNIAAGDPVGVAVQGNFNLGPVGGRLVGVSIGLNVSGGYNGDYYAWLKSPDGTLVQLLNQPGSDIFGSPASGFGNGGINSFLLSSSGSVNIQGVDGTYGSSLTGTYSAAGDLNAFGTESSPSGSGNGNWTLFIDDLGSGGGSGTLENWTLNETIIAAPEPPYMVVSLLLFAVGVAVFRSRRVVAAP